MRFNYAWSQVLKENLTLKVGLVALTITSISFCFLSLKLALKPATIIERSCYASVAKQGNANHTSEEIKSFIKLALKQRFNSFVEPNEAYLTEEQILAREEEQKAFSKQEMIQNIVVNDKDIKITEDKTIITATRLMSVKGIRSAIPFPLEIEVESKSRTKANPYGLVLTKIKVIKTKKDKKND